MRNKFKFLRTHLPAWAGVLLAVFASLAGPLGFLPPGAAAQEANSATRVLVLKDGTLIDGTGNRPMTDAVIVIRGNRIESVGAGSRKPQIPDGAEIQDVSGKYILPGLIDSHFHYSDWMPGELLLAFGQTSAFHYGPRIAKATPAGDGTPVWPRIYFSGRTVSSPVKMTLLGPVGGGGTVETPEQAREVVRQNRQAGASFITVHENLSAELLAAVIAEAHSMGLAVIGHQVNAADAVRAGLDGVEHMTGVAFAAITDRGLVERLGEMQAKGPTVRSVSHPISNPEFYMQAAEEKKILRLMVDRHAFLNPTVTTRWQRVEPRTQEFFEQYKKMSEDPAWHSIPEKVRQSWLETLVPYPESTDVEHKRQEQEGYRKTQEFLRDFTKAGGKIISGTDFSYSAVMGLRLHQELQLLVEAGLTPMQAILTATRYPTELIHIDKDLGTVEAGKLADLLVVDANPLDRIENLMRISRVILNGKVVPTHFRPESLLSGK